MLSFGEMLSHKMHGTQVQCIMYYTTYSLSLVHACIGAGGGVFLTYATYMKRSQGAVKLGSTIPGVNNLVRYY